MINLENLIDMIKFLKIQVFELIMLLIMLIMFVLAFFDCQQLKKTFAEKLDYLFNFNPKLFLIDLFICSKALLSSLKLLDV